MGNVQATLHAVNIVMFCIAFYIHVLGYIEINRCRAADIIKRIGKNTMLAGIFVTSLFLFLQVDWLLQNHNQAVGGPSAWSWLLFDYALGMYLMIMGALVRVFTKWKDRADNKRRRKQEPAHD